MIAIINNESFGYSVATFDVWAAVSNPDLVRYNPATSSLIHSGSVEVYKYNINTDTHDLKMILHREITADEDLLLATETGSILHTEPTGSVAYTEDLDLLVDVGAYYTASEDGYGRALDLHSTYLAVGYPYYTTTYNTTVTSSIVITGSGVDIYDLSVLDIDPYAVRLVPLLVAHDFSSSIAPYDRVEIYVYPNQGFRYAVLQTIDTTIPGDNWEDKAVTEIPRDGGTAYLDTTFTVADETNLLFRVIGVVDAVPYLMTLPNPDPEFVTGSFGSSVSINDEWIAVGAPNSSGSRGAVFLYREVSSSLSYVSWSLYQTLILPPEIEVGDNFGRSICLNKATGSYSGSIVVGTSKPSGSKAYVYAFDGTNWALQTTLTPDYLTVYPLTFYPSYPVFESGSYPNYWDSFGWSVGMYADTIIVGAPTDRHIYEYTGSSVYHQGAVYFFERCPNRSDYYLARKSYGNGKTIVNNRLGESVGVWGEYAVAGVPKLNEYSMSICYLRGALFQQHYCTDLTNQIQGQFILYNQTTGSIPDSSNLDWDIVNVYQVKKRILSPYRAYGFDSHISQDFIIVGAPMLIAGDYRLMDMTPQSGSFTGSLDNINDITGKAYIYNLNNLREQFYVGNVFYRNGKMVVMSSGSAFDGLLMSSIQGEEYEYDLFFKSKYTIFEKQIVCPVDVGEFNVSTNPTAVSLPTSSYDVNHNGKFDYQDCDVLLRYMAYKNSETSGAPSTDWTSSLLSTVTDEDVSVYNMYTSSWSGTDDLFEKNYSMINNTLYSELDFNDDNRIDIRDMNILWKYFTCRLTQKNYDTYITPNSERKYLSDIIDFLNDRTMKGKAPAINSNFIDYSRLSKLDPTGSYLAPYVTTVGLYNGCDLVAVAKLGSPIKIIPDFPFNFIVKIDF